MCFQAFSHLYSTQQSFGLSNSLPFHVYHITHWWKMNDTSHGGLCQTRNEWPRCELFYLGYKPFSTLQLNHGDSSLTHDPWANNQYEVRKCALPKGTPQWPPRFGIKPETTVSYSPTQNTRPRRVIDRRFEYISKLKQHSYNTKWMIIAGQWWAVLNSGRKRYLLHQMCHTKWF